MAMPDTVYISLPNDPKVCAGAYDMLVGTMADGLPVWRLRGGAEWYLFSGEDHCWYVHGQTAKSVNFNHKGGWVTSGVHNRKPPNEIVGRWKQAEEGKWKDADPDILCFAGLPETVYISLPTDPRACGGCYDLYFNGTADNFPVWKLRGNAQWYLFSGEDKCWYVHGQMVKNCNFRHKGGWVTSGVHHRRPPHELAGKWKQAEDGRWKEADPRIEVFADVPETVYISLPRDPKACAGAYELVHGTTADELPVWRRRGSADWYLYSGSDHCWYIHGSEAREAHFDLASGCVTSGQHNRRRPDEVVGKWRQEEQGSWKDADASILCFANMPETVCLALPDDPKSCAGTYDLLYSATADCFPVWKRRGVTNEWYLFSGSDHCWYVHDRTAKDREFNLSGGWVTSGVHGRRGPNEVIGTWKQAAHGRWKDPDSSIVVLAGMPETLFVHLPRDPKGCAGFYELLFDVSADALLVWKLKEGSDWWLFSGQDHCWYIHGRTARDADFKLSGGWVTSGVHSRKAPDEIIGRWKQAEDGAWKDVDPEILCLRMPEIVHLELPTDPKHCAGTYRVLRGVTADSLPVYKLDGAEWYLFSGEDHCWYVHGTTAKNVEFRIKGGWVTSGVHNWSAPDDIVGRWKQAEDGKWKDADPSILVTSPAPVRFSRPPLCKPMGILAPPPRGESHTADPQPRSDAQTRSEPSGSAQPKPNLDQLSKIFMIFDEDRDGVVTERDLKRCLPRMDPFKWTDDKISAMMRAADKDGKGTLTEEEFVAWLSEIGADERKKLHEMTQARIADREYERSETTGLIKGLFDDSINPCIPIKDAVAKLPMDLKSELWVANKHFRKGPPKEALDACEGLDFDGAVAIYLYTCESELYHELNHNLRAGASRSSSDFRSKFFPYMRILMQALRVMAKGRGRETVNRGVALGLTKLYPEDFAPGENIIWWGFTSTTKNISVLSNEMFLGTEGDRTIFQVSTCKGINIRQFSAMPGEAEILLPAGTVLKVDGVLDVGNGLAIVQCSDDDDAPDLVC